jgi:hypothetical protein
MSTKAPDLSGAFCIGIRIYKLFETAKPDKKRAEAYRRTIPQRSQRDTEGTNEYDIFIGKPYSVTLCGPSVLLCVLRGWRASFFSKGPSVAMLMGFSNTGAVRSHR